MIRKEIVDPGRVRHMPDGFGWVDHRLVRKGYLRGRSRDALALYLFLVTVADFNGVSYYSRESLCEQLNFTIFELEGSRSELINAGFIAYRKPFYQVLELPLSEREKENFSRVFGEARECDISSTEKRKEGCVALGEVINSMTGGLEND